MMITKIVIMITKITEIITIKTIKIAKSAMRTIIITKISIIITK